MNIAFLQIFVTLPYIFALLVFRKGAKVVFWVLAITVALLPFMQSGYLFYLKSQHKITTTSCIETLMVEMPDGIAPGNEVEVYGNRYDIVSKKKQGKYWVIKAFKDKEEYALNHAMFGGDSKQGSKTLKAYQNPDWICTILKIKNPLFFENKGSFVNYKARLLAGIFSIHLPPPDWV